MAFCLTKPKAEAFRQAIRNGRIDPFKMATLSSKQIRELLTPFVGAENAKQVNALYESKLLLKNKQRGYITWVKKITGISQQVKRDLISRIERMKDVLDPAKEQRFLEDLAEAYLRIGVTEQEARTISRMSEQVRLAREKALPDGRFTSSQDRYDYGKKSVMLEEYVNEKKLQSRKVTCCVY
jgi:ribosomal protein S18